MKSKIRVLIEEISKYSSNQLKRKKDLETIIDLSYSDDHEQYLKELTFTSKYVQGLLRILTLGTSNSEQQNISLINRDISTNLQKIREKIEQIIFNSDDKTKQYFRENYLRLSQDNLLNLIELINDLEWTKKYLNYLKRESPN